MLLAPKKRLRQRLGLLVHSSVILTESAISHRGCILLAEIAIYPGTLRTGTLI